VRSLVICAVAAALMVPSAIAAWAPQGLGNGTLGSRTLGSGNMPTVSVAAKKVTITWAASTFTTGGNVPSYAVRRYNASTGVLQSIGATCMNLVAGLTCTENNTPVGTWRYTVTPAAGAWRGGESAKSSIATVV
jgi:hypothetical protein